MPLSSSGSTTPRAFSRATNSNDRQGLNREPANRDWSSAVESRRLLIHQLRLPFVASRQRAGSAASKHGYILAIECSMLGLDATPMAPAGGLFIAVMGSCVALGGQLARHRKLLLIVGAALATVALVTIGPHLQTGQPTSLQVWSLLGAIALEGALVRVAFAVNRGRDERRRMLCVLLAVGVHFLPMAVAFGPLCLALSAACITNALAGLCVSRQVTLATLWTVDGVVKVAAGVAMMASAGTGAFG